MSREVNRRSASRRFAPAGILFAVFGVALFAYFVWRAGPWEIWSNISRMGAGFLAVLALSGARFAVRAWAWTLCFEPPHKLSVWEAFKAHLVGDTVGNIVSLGMVVSEPTKAAMVRERVPLLQGVAALAVENLFYMLSVVVFLFCGTATLLLMFPVTKLLWWLSVGIMGGVVVSVGVASWAVRRQLRFLTAALSWANRRGLGRGSFERRHARAAALEEKVYGFHTRHRARFVPILLLQSSFHLLGVAEAYLTLHLISDAPPTLLVAFLFETVNRIINIVFKYVPLRAGVERGRARSEPRLGRGGDGRARARAEVRRDGGRHARHRPQGADALLDDGRHHPPGQPRPLPARRRRRSRARAAGGHERESGVRSLNVGRSRNSGDRRQNEEGGDRFCFYSDS